MSKVKKNEETKKGEEKSQVSGKKGKKEKEKENEKPKIEQEEEDVKTEEGVLTFYIELQDEPEIVSDGRLSPDSDEDN